jgi:hypothetical protein
MTYLVLSEITLAAVQAEATRAHLVHGDDSMLGAKHTDADRLAILGEEYGEVCREINEHKLGKSRGGEHRDRLVIELVQTAAMALTWVEHLEGGGHRPTVKCPECSAQEGSGDVMVHGVAAAHHAACGTPSSPFIDRAPRCECDPSERCTCLYVAGGERHVPVDCSCQGFDHSYARQVELARARAVESYATKYGKTAAGMILTALTDRLWDLTTADLAREIPPDVTYPDAHEVPNSSDGPTQPGDLALAPHDEGTSYCTSQQVYSSCGATWPCPHADDEGQDDEDSEIVPIDYDPGPECDDEGGMSEHRHAVHPDWQGGI